MANNKFINDQWTLKDDLGIGRVGDEVARLVLEANAPFTVGVTGKWGSGKTSIMRRAYATLGGLPMQQKLAFADKPGVEGLDNENLRYSNQNRQPSLSWPRSAIRVAEHTHCVWFSPWQHQNEANPLIPLLLEIESQFKVWYEKSTAKNKTRQAFLAASTLLERVIDVGASLINGKNVKIASGTTEAVTKAWQQGDDGLTKISDGQRFHLLFEDAVNTVLAATDNVVKAQTHARLVIFIDDLDRCEESQIIQLLEAIKLYLHSKRCIFVLGLDETAVLDALNRHWERGEDINREYLEKLFQARISVPLPVPASMLDVVKKQLINNGIGKENVKENEKDIAAYMANDIVNLLEPNPRKVKNFVNGLVAQWRILDAKSWINEENIEEARRFVMFFYIQQYHRSIWRLLERQPEVLMYLKFVLGRDGAADKPKEIEGFGSEQQQMLTEILKRAFSHILPNREDTNDDKDKHGSQKIDDAVTDFINRQDRKRSDEYLITLFEALIDINMPLNLNYLMINSQNNPQTVSNDND